MMFKKNTTDILSNIIKDQGDDLNKFELNAYRKIWLVAQVIQRQRIIDNPDKPSVPTYLFSEIFDYSSNIKEHNDHNSIIDHLNDKEKGIEKMGYYPEKGTPKTFIDFELNTEKFDQYYEKTKNDYLNCLKRTTGQDNPELPKTKNDIVYNIVYQNQGCKIFINNFLFANPNFNSENEIIFDYIYKNPNRRISKSELEKNCLGTDQTFKKSLKSVVAGLGFKGELKEVFFNVSEQGIIFMNPIFREDLEKVNIKYLKFDEI